MYFFAILSVMTGSFQEFVIITSLIVIHEIGHSIFAYFFKVKIKEIYIYPLGGISKFKMDLNIHPIKEFFILIGGPLFQFFAYFTLLKILPSKKEIINFYHYGILYFNLLPIYPLDGGKILKLFLELFIPYKYSLKLIIQSSYIIIVIIVITMRIIKINIIVMSLFLLILIFKEQKKIEYIYNKFLLERYINNYHFFKRKIIQNERQFYRNKSHILKLNNEYISEEDYLKIKYQKKY